MRRLARGALLGWTVLMVSGPARSQRGREPCREVLDLNLPVLNVGLSATLGPSYGCGNDTSKGYGTTALFLSDYSRLQNSPDLLFEGACRSLDFSM